MSLQKILKEKLAKYDNEFSGVVLVKREDEVLYGKATGYAHQGWQIPNNLETRFDTASITKLFTTVGILQLIDRGEITFETSVIDFLGLRGTKISSEVNVFHLLTHTSGIADDADEEEGEDYEDIWKLKPNYMVRETIDFLPQFIHKAPKFRPGEKCNYNNVAFVLLGLIIEKVTGERYRDYIKTNLLERIGMNNTEFCSMDGIYHNVAEGYSPLWDENDKIIGYRKNIYSFPPIGSPDGGAFTTVKDLDLFIRELKNGNVLSKELTEDLFKPKVNYRQGKQYNELLGYCFHFFVDQTGKVIFMHKGGFNSGVNNSFNYYPEIDTTVIIMSNNECSTSYIHRDIREELLK